MKRFIASCLCITFVMCITIVNEVEARIGTFDVGYGTKARGMGGCAVALPQDTLVGAINPAGMVWIGNRLDIGVQLLAPPRIYTHSNSVLLAPRPPLTGKYRARPAVIPLAEAGFNRMIDESSSMGATLYTAGGSSVYKRSNGIAAINGSVSNKLGFDLKQALLAFTYSRYVLPGHSLGVSFVLVEQALSIKGLTGFANPNFSVNANAVTNKNFDYATGAAFRIGYFGQVYEGVTVGASYTTRTAMSRFRRYSGILPQAGRCDIPAILAAGATWEPCDDASIAFEWQRLFYKDCNLWGNSFNNYILAGGNQRSGATNGPGFGWSNMDIYKVGADYRWDCTWTFRGGYCLSRIPYRSTQLDVNLLTNALGRHHMTLGFTYDLNDCEQIDFAYFHMFRTRIAGPSQLITGGLGTITQRTYEDSVSLNYGRNF